MDEFKPAPIKPLLSVDDFGKVDIRVGTIQEVHDVESSKKLVRLEVFFGDHTREILAGMKTEREDLDALKGCQALFLVNLEPRKMAGYTSEGMIVDIGYADGPLPALAVPERSVPAGSRLG
ncbi:MAG TPA: tRNA-binding protein [Acidobacteriota bacterium]|nr:tRNA-binding protein [Acidobacteriota bacterium]